MSVLQTYQVTTNREDLTDVITNITPKKTPFLSLVQETKAYNTLHENMVDDLDVPTANVGSIEGADFVEEDQQSPTRQGSYTQIFKEHPKVSDTQLAVKNAGVKNLYNYNVTLKTKKLALRIEFACIRGIGNSGASGTARKIMGALEWTSTNTASGTGAGEIYTQSKHNNLLETIWAEGGDPDITFVNGTLKRVISGFTDGVTKNLEAKNKRMIAVVNVYEGDFGIQRIIGHRYMPANTVAHLEQDKWALAWLRKTKHTPLAKTGDSTRGQIVAEVALECRNELANGKYENVTN